MAFDLFPPSKVPYFIFSPGWTHKSSGVRVLHLLCHALNESGQRAYLFPSTPRFSRNPELNTPLAMEVMNDWVAFLDAGLDYVVVYPDIVRGNPLESKKVVRYLLAPAGAYGGDKEFSEKDKVYGYVKDLAEPVLCLPPFDPRVFYPSVTEKRSGAVYYAHKYNEIYKNALLPLTSEAKKLEGTPSEVAQMLREAEICYLYERTEVEVQARMCGCPVFPVVTDFWNGKRPEEFEDRAGISADLVSWDIRFEEQLRAFVKDTQEWKA